MLIAVVGALYGGIYLHGTIKRRSEAKYGFYINFLQFIKQMEIFINDKNKDVIRLIAKPDIHQQGFKMKKEAIKGFKVLSENFLFFLNSSKDIIPPGRKKIWYNNLLKIVEFLQWGTMAGDFYLIDDDSDADEEINCKWKCILKVLEETKSILSKAIGFKKKEICVTTHNGCSCGYR
ncbi:MAG: hypothetical protein LBG10_07475 [Treponema sp.]|nr:hypothetical protein [Treponema sp.]